MQETDIGQMYIQLPDDIDTMLPTIGFADSYSACETSTIDWTQLSNECKPSTSGSWGVVDEKVMITPVKDSKMFAVESAPLPLELSADLLQSLMAMNGVFDDETLASLLTPPVAIASSDPLGLLTAPSPAAADHSTYVKRRRLSSESCDDGYSIVGALDTAGTAKCDDGHDEKYRERRRKNNIASRRSRELRKRKMETTEQRAQELEEENKRLRARVEELERTGRLMKELLLQRLTHPRQ